MRVQWAMLARYAQAEAGMFTIVGGGFDSIILGEYPAVAQTFIAVSLRYGPEEEGGPATIEFVVRDEHVNAVGEPAVIQIDHLGLNPEHPPGWEAGLPIAGPFQVPLEAPGTYSVNILIDGALKFDIPFRAGMPG